MPTWTRRIPFQVDVAGVIQVMGTSLYSRFDAPIRELIQNGHDAIQRRRQRDLSYTGRLEIRLDPSSKSISFADDGVGLSPDEAEKYLGTLGIGITGLLKGHHPSTSGNGTADYRNSLIGQFGIGLFSAFMLAEQLIVESRSLDCEQGVRWVAGPGTDIELSSLPRENSGTSITLLLKPEHAILAADPSILEAAIKEYADYLPVPIFLNDSDTRLNVINVAWFDATPDVEAIELAIQSHFQESPLAVIPVRRETPVPIAGALYITPQRTPGFASEATLTTTIHRMVISRHTQDLLPHWASFVRGVLEIPQCSPTASREDLVRDRAFEHVRSVIEELLFEHFEQLAEVKPAELDAILSWHRYTFAGSALGNERLRRLLRQSYRFHTSQGNLTFAEVIERSAADPLHEMNFESVIWYNIDRRQERWVNSLFAEHDSPCVHATRSFEESLLAALAGDEAAMGKAVDVRIASPGSPAFASQILGIRDLEPAPEPWSDYLSATDAKIMCASFRDDVPVMAFLNERHELRRTYDELRTQGTVPAAFQRLIDRQLSETESARNEIVLNRSHRLVGRSLAQRPGTPLASVLRILVSNALQLAGAAVPRAAQQQQTDDLDWIAEALWGRSQ